MENNYNIDEIVKDIDFESKFLKKRDNNMLLSDEHLEILKRYQINYLNYNNLNSLIYDIEEILNDTTDNDDLEWLSKDLSERNYYQNTKK